MRGGVCSAESPRGFRENKELRLFIIQIFLQNIYTKDNGIADRHVCAYARCFCVNFFYSHLFISKLNYYVRESSNQSGQQGFARWRC